MEYLDQPFEVSVGSGRRPTPTTYEHLRDYPALVKQYLRLSSQTDIVNVNDILNLTGNLYVSNEISRVIAQVIGKLDPGFITIEGTEAGALHVHVANIPDPIEVNTTLQAGDELIGKVQIDGLPKTYETAKIHISGTGNKEIIAVDGTKTHYICSIMFTVFAETNLRFLSDTTELSGLMDFGGSGEPKGLAHNFGSVPMKCTAAKNFQIYLSIDVQVSGVVTYYSE